MNQPTHAKGRKKESQTAKAIKTKSTKESQDQNDSNLPVVDGDYYPTSDDQVIAVMGVTGSGKSAFISLLTDGNAAVGHNLEACTSEVKIYNYLHRGKERVYLIDTPGFDDTSRSDTEVLKEIVLYLTGLYHKGIKLAGLLYLHRITDGRMLGSSLKSINMLKVICGESCFPNLVLVTTMWNILEHYGLSNESGMKREQELGSNDKFWGSIKKRGSRMVRHTGDLESALSIVSILVDKKSPVVLDIQHQMVDEGKRLDETTAGKFVQKGLLDTRMRYEREIAEYKQRRDDALKEKDTNLAASLQKEMDEYKAGLSGIIASEDGLKANLSKIAKEKDSQYTARQLKSEQMSSAKTKSYGDNLCQLQDDLSRISIEHKREMAQLRLERRSKSTKESLRLEKLMQEKEKYWLAQQSANKKQIRLERAIRQARENEIVEATKRRPSRPMVGFFSWVISSLGVSPKKEKRVLKHDREGRGRGK